MIKFLRKFPRQTILIALIILLIVLFISSTGTKTIES